jgi:hypothetical protein
MPEFIHACCTSCPSNANKCNYYFNILYDTCPTVRDKAAAVHATKAYRGNRSLLHVFLIYAIHRRCVFSHSPSRNRPRHPFQYSLTWHMTSPLRCCHILHMEYRWSDKTAYLKVCDRHEADAQFLPVPLPRRDLARGPACQTNRLENAVRVCRMWREWRCRWLWRHVDTLSQNVACWRCKWLWRHTPEDSNLHNYHS